MCALLAFASKSAQRKIFTLHSNIMATSYISYFSNVSKLYMTSWVRATFIILVTFLNLAIIYDIMATCYIYYFSNVSKFSHYI